MVTVFSLKSFHFFFTFLRLSKIFNLIFLDFNQRIWLVGAANSHSNMKDQFLYLCQFLLLGYKLFKSHPFKKKKNSQPCLSLRSLMHSFFFSLIATISLLSLSLYLFTFYLHLSSLKYGFHVHHVPKTTLIRVTRGLLIIKYNDIFLHDFRVVYFSPWNHFFGFLIWLFLWRKGWVCLHVYSLLLYCESLNDMDGRPAPRVWAKEYRRGYGGG